MSKLDPDGQAFARGGSASCFPANGLTVRQYFAIEFAAALATRQGLIHEGYLAHSAVKLADALIEELNR